MRTSALALPLILACVVLLSACGDSGSSSAVTNTVTVPSGKLGAETDLNCSAPKIHGVRIVTFSFLGIDCREAGGHAAAIVRSGRLTGWTCNRRDSGRIEVSCRADRDRAKYIRVGWSVTS